MKNLPYNDAKQLLLQGVCIKLPEWEGYWKFNTEEKQIFAHLKSGEVVPAQAKYTFNENWEIATIDNCPILKREMLAKQIISNGKIINIVPRRTKIGRDLIIQFLSERKVLEVNFGAFCALVGSDKAKEMIVKYINESVFGDFPKEIRDEVEKLLESLDKVCESIAKEAKKEMEK